MNPPKITTYNADEIHAMRLYKAELYSRMTPAEAERDFKRSVEEAENTMEALRKEKRFATN